MKTRLTFAIILTCCITISCEKQAKETVPPHHHLGYSEFLSDSLKITAYPDRNIIMLTLLADKTKRNSYQEEHLLAYWGYNGEEYNLPLYRSLTDFSDVKLSAVFLFSCSPSCDPAPERRLLGGKRVPAIPTESRKARTPRSKAGKSLRRSSLPQACS